jgi:translation elongation factor P/translation initiation factor 5A
MKQQSKERKRGLRVMERMESLRVEEREKVKQGKKPFFLKNSVKNTIGLEERCVFAALLMWLLLWC